MEIQRFYTENFLRNYDYVLKTSCGKTIVVDPSDPSLLLQSVDKVDYYFITHEHPDHIAGLDQLVETLGGEVVAPRVLKGKLPVSVHQAVQEGDLLEFEREAFRVIEIPGHIMSHIGFILTQEGREHCAFLGDTVFNAGVGNTVSGNSHVLYRTISEKVLALDSGLVLYPEHDYWETNLKFTLSLEPENQKALKLLEDYQSGNYSKSGKFPPSTIAQEKEYNLFFRTHLPIIQQQVRQRCQLPAHCSQEEIFVGLRHLRDHWNG